jgi:hypothetical protein
MREVWRGDSIIEINFPKLNHFWMDAGLLGLYHVARNEQPEKYNVELVFRDDGVVFKGKENDVQNFLLHSYNVMLSVYYNTSTQKQIEKNEGFYYDSINGKFVRFPKVKTKGIAGLVPIKASAYKPTKKAAKFKKIVEEGSGKKIKSKILEDEYSYLQDPLDNFLKDTSFEITSARLLIDGRDIIYPSIHLDTLSGKEKGHCFVCGQSSHSLNDIVGTVYPMITGSSGVLSFFSSGTNLPKVCWKCDYVAKFAPVTGFYVTNPTGSLCHIYFPYSPSLEKMYNVFRNLESVKFTDPTLLRNFDNQLLGGYFQKPFEQLFSFLYALYRVVMVKRSSDSVPDEFELDFEKLYDITLNKSPLEFFVMYTESLGDTQMGKMIFPYQDSIYLFRLVDHLEKNKIELKPVMQQLIDFEKVKKKQIENATLTRNRICESILKKQPIIGLVEQHVWMSKLKSDIKPLYDFVILYEKTIRQGRKGMDQEIIDVAISVGKTIGISLAQSEKKGKGDLFRLRKARKPEEFLNEINRIQMKYGTLVNADLYNKGQMMEENFSEFKQFCMIAALNSFNAGSHADAVKPGAMEANS